ncbi:MAG: hypothetical protein QGI89_02520 [Candidatus Woesearchaeota archaeon]|jgi:hypothetical protein|nr:hypothetical protein [Candidatus Woesearchaeota archaeon]MDP7322728.1 hypothetical protein [Candidatus Woesearchaeota archaeon]|tara:strand:+ start:62 stop:508 length:447 start_codon:yes stop_codon:yes gene_type:complete
MKKETVPEETLFEETVRLRTNADELLKRKDLSEHEEDELLRELFGHTDKVARKFLDHSRLSSQIGENTPGKFQRKFEVLEAELGDLTELGRELELINRYIEKIGARRRRREQALMRTLRGSLRPLEADVTEDSAEIRAILARMNRARG